MKIKTDHKYLFKPENLKFSNIFVNIFFNVFQNIYSF